MKTLPLVPYKTKEPNNDRKGCLIHIVGKIIRTFMHDAFLRHIEMQECSFSEFSWVQIARWCLVIRLHVDLLSTSSSLCNMQIELHISNCLIY
jgi:hypothetical protein